MSVRPGIRRIARLGLRLGARRSAPLVALLVTACGPGVRTPLPEYVRREPGRCQLARDLSEGMEEMATRCAEQFIRHNGYTEVAAASDSLRWVAERDDRGEWSDIFAVRRGTLRSDAEMVQCSRRRCFVFFRARNLADHCRMRIVTMTQVFTELQVLPGFVTGSRCTRAVS